MKHPENIDLSWAAGFIDGEGHLGVRATRDRRGKAGEPRKERLSPRIVVGQCDRGPLDFLAQLFGGNVRLRRKRTTTAREHWAWELGGAGNIASAICRLRPYFHLKGAEADALLPICQRITAWPSGTILTDQEIELRNELTLRLHEVKQGTRSPARRVEPSGWHK